MELKANTWFSKKSQKISKQQAEQIAGGVEKLIELEPQHNPKAFAINAGHSTLARLIQGADLIRSPTDYFVVGSDKEIAEVMADVAAGKTGLLLSQQLEARAQRLKMIKRRAENPRRPAPMW